MKRDESDGDAWWNLGIAATAIGEWPQAREAWQRCGVTVPDGVGPIEANYGLTPIRLAPATRGEVVWSDRIDPARAIIRKVPLPESGHLYGDLMLHDGAPNGTRVRDGHEVPVFDALERLSESESRIDLFLETDGSARVVLQTWSPGSAGVRAVDTIAHAGTWSASGNEITLRYGAGSATLEFSEARSFEEFECSGEAPGLRGTTGTGGEDLLVGTTLWESEALRMIPDPCQ